MVYLHLPTILNHKPSLSFNVNMSQTYQLHFMNDTS